MTRSRFVFANDQVSGELPQGSGRHPAIVPKVRLGGGLFRRKVRGLFRTLRGPG